MNRGRIELKNWLFAICGYLLLGALGLSLAIPPGYASPVFPAAGFALAVLIHSGSRMLPAVWLGSLLLNLGVGLGNGSLSLTAILVAVGIATGSSLQAWAGSTLVRKYVSEEDLRLERFREIFRFLTLGGAVACLISASVGTSSLFTAGIVDTSSFHYAWWNWYVGDLLGVTTFSVLVLGFLRRDDSYWRLRLRTMAPPVLAITFLAAGLFMASAHWEKTNRVLDFEENGEHLIEITQSKVALFHEMLGSLSRYFESSAEVAPNEFSHFTNLILEAHPEISALSFNRLVTKEARPAFEQLMAKRLRNSEFRITERHEGVLVPAAERPDYVVVSMINPIAGNQAALGFDIQSEPNRRDTIQRANNRHDYAATAPLWLVQGSREQLGMLLLVPVLTGIPREADKATPTLAGYAVAVIKIDQFFQAAIGKQLPEGMILEVIDPNPTTNGPSLIYRSSQAAEKAGRDALIWRSKLQLADREFSFTLKQSVAYAEIHRPWVAWAIGVVAMLFASVFQLLLLVVTGRTSLIQRQVDQQTLELNQQNQALLASEAKLNRVIDVMPEVVLVVDTHGVIQNANERVLDILGYQTSELLGQAVETLIPAHARHHHANLRQSYLQHPEIRPMGVGKELHALHKSGQEIPVEIALAPMSDTEPLFIIVTVVDISQRLAKEQALRDSERRFRLMSESIHDYSIIFLDENGVISTWNKGVERIKGYQGHEVLGQPISIFYTPEDKAAGLPEQLLAHACKFGSVENQGWRVRKDSTRFFADVIVTAIRDESGELIGYAKITRDVSERKRLEDDLRHHQGNLELLVQQRTADLEVAKEAAEAASRAKTAFLSMASHELRTPMNGIMGTISLAKRQTDDPKLLDYLSKADRSAKNLLSIINDVLDISRIEADKLTLMEVPFSIREIVGHVQDSLDDLAANKGLTLVFTGGDSLLGYIFQGDPTRITQILMNLVGNALKFTQKGGVEVDVAIQGQSGGQRVLHFEVRDTGIGIAEKDISRIFNPFEQGDSSTTRKYGGTGLGLALCKRLAEAIGGSIGIASTEGVGSTFWFNIPAIVANYQDLPPNEESDSRYFELLISRHAGANILIAEDEPINQEIVMSMLEDAKLNVFAVNDGAEAVKAAKSRPFELILMDMNMPNLDGIEASHQIRSIPGYEKTPIIALTANAFSEDRNACLEAGMNDHIGKPVIPGALYAAVLRWLDFRTGEDC